MKTIIKQRKTWIIATVAFMIATVVASCYSFQKASTTTAYVDVGKVYNDFDLKKELETKYTNIQSARKTVLDSMMLGMNALSARVTNLFSGDVKDSLQKELLVRQQDYTYRKQAFDDDDQNVTDQYSAQIWKQLNQYIQDYGKAKGYDYIFGGDGSGSLMYASDGLNITDDVKLYVNQRYKDSK